ncbi:zinc metalloprotease [Clostridia bacterium]|nr:zinc metalloprotease [Clostridia bacterium]
MQILYWILAIVLLGVVILLHELGHFWSARKMGIKVMSFGMGFGPKLYSWTGKDGVLYVLRLLPLGGYCRYYGEDESVGDARDAFNNQPIYKRAISTAAGPLMNFLTAIVAFFILYSLLGIPTVLTSIQSVVPNSPAEEAGMLTGDEIIYINNTPVSSVVDIQNAIAGSEGLPLDLTVTRGGSTIPLTVVPRVIDEAARRAQIGIQFATGSVRFNPIQSIGYSFRMTGATVGAMFDFLKGLITRTQSTDDMVGPVGTLALVSEQTQAGGVSAYISMLAMISVNLGFFNLLPIPGLDGSRLLFLLIEKIRGKRSDPNKEGLIHLIGIALLLLLMLPVYIRDIIRLF